MKKIILTVLVILFSTMSVNAAEYIYGAGGRQPIARVSRGQVHSIHNFGSNALFTPQNASRAGARNRAIAREKAMTRAIANCGSRRVGSGYGYGYGYGSRYGYGAQVAETAHVAPVEISRFDKNYKISPPKSYTKNGITYFN